MEDANRHANMTGYFLRWAHYPVPLRSELEKLLDCTRTLKGTKSQSDNSDSSSGTICLTLQNLFTIITNYTAHLEKDGNQNNTESLLHGFWYFVAFVRRRHHSQQHSISIQNAYTQIQTSLTQLYIAQEQIVKKKIVPQPSQNTLGHATHIRDIHFHPPETLLPNIEYKLNLLKSIPNGKPNLDEADKKLGVVFSNQIVTVVSKVDTLVQKHMPRLYNQKEQSTADYGELWGILVWYRSRLENGGKSGESNHETPTDEKKRLQDELLQIRKRIYQLLDASGVKPADTQTDSNRANAEATQQLVADKTSSQTWTTMRYLARTTGRNALASSVGWLQNNALIPLAGAVVQSMGLFQPMVNAAIATYAVSKVAERVASSFNQTELHVSSRPDTADISTSPEQSVTKNLYDLWHEYQASFVVLPATPGEQGQDADSLVYYYTTHNGQLGTAEGGPEIDSNAVTRCLNTVFMRSEFINDTLVVKHAERSRDYYEVFMKKFIKAAKIHLEVLRDNPNVESVLRRLWVVSKALKCVGEYVDAFITTGRGTGTDQDVFPYNERIDAYRNKIRVLKERVSKDKDALNSTNLPDLQDAEAELARLQKCQDTLERIQRTVDVAIQTNDLDALFLLSTQKTFREIIDALCAPSIGNTVQTDAGTRRQKAIVLLAFLMERVKNKAGVESRAAPAAADEGRATTAPAAADEGLAATAAAAAADEKVLRYLRTSILHSDTLLPHKNRANLLQTASDLASSRTVHQATKFLRVLVSQTASAVGQLRTQTANAAGAVQKFMNFHAEPSVNVQRVADELSHVDSTEAGLMRTIEESYAVLPAGAEEPTQRVTSYRDLAQRVRRQANRVFTDEASDNCYEYYDDRLRKFRVALDDVYTEDQALQEDATVTPPAGPTTAPTAHEKWTVYKRLVDRHSTPAPDAGQPAVIQNPRRPMLVDAWKLECELLKFIDDALEDRVAFQTCKTHRSRRSRSRRSSRRSRRSSRRRSRSRDIRKKRMAQDDARLHEDIDRYTKRVYDHKKTIEETKATIKRLEDERKQAITEMQTQQQTVTYLANKPSTPLSRRRLTARTDARRTLKKSLQRIRELNEEIEDLNSRVERANKGYQRAIDRLHRIDVQLNSENTFLQQFLRERVPASEMETSVTPPVNLRFAQCDWTPQNTGSPYFDFNDFQYGIGVHTPLKSSLKTLLKRYWIITPKQGMQNRYNTDNRKCIHFMLIRRPTRITRIWKHNQSIYYLNYCVTDTSNSTFQEIGYAGNIHPQNDWYEKKHTHRGALSAFRNLKKGNYSTKHVFKTVAGTFDNALHFCRAVLMTKKDNNDTFFFTSVHNDPGDAVLTALHQAASEVSSKRTPVRTQRRGAQSPGAQTRRPIVR